MDNRVSIDNITAEHFNQLVDLLAQWISSNHLKVRFWMPSSVMLDFSESFVSEELRKAQIPEECLHLLRHDIPAMISAILTGRRNVITRFLSDNVEDQENAGKESSKSEIQEEIKQRIRYVEQRIVTQDMSREFAVKKTSKSNNYAEVSWEVVQKQVESTGDPPPNLAYAIVRLVLQKPPIRGDRRPIIFPFFDLTAHQETESITLTMTIDDIQDVIENLNKASLALRKALAEDGGD